MLLRPTQEKALADVQSAYRSGRRKPLLCAHTAFGKSTLTASMLSRTKKSVLYLCPRENLMDRAREDLTKAGIRHGVIHGSSNALPNTYSVHVGVVATVSRRLHRLPPFQWVIHDEAHLAMSDTWSEILAHYSDAWHLGMSATPCRLDGKGLGTYFDEIVYGPSIRESTARGYLAPIRVFAPPNGINAGSTGKLSLDKAALLLNTRTITGSAIAEMRKRAPDRQAIGFCCNRQHAEDAATQFREAGIAAIAVDSTMADRFERIRDFERGRAQALFNVELLTTGYDFAPVSLGIMLRDTESLALALQMWGRFVRTAPGKTDALIHDHVGMVMRHGMPDGDREWTLDGREQRPTAPAVRQCPKCFAVFSPAPRCPACGVVLAAMGGGAGARGIIKHVDGELEEVLSAKDAVKAKALRQRAVKEALKSAVTREEFMRVAYRFGYKPGWGINMHRLYTAGRQKGRRSA